jgi:predicted peptidase
MHQHSVVRFASLIAALGLGHPAWGAEAAQSVHAFTQSRTQTFAYRYLLALPSGYEGGGDTRWPLLLFLHGAGERGDDVWSVARHGPPKLLRSEGSTPAGMFLAANFIVVSPQCPKGAWWDTESLLALLDEISSTHRVDSRRVYLAGLSMGGFGTWELGVSHPERFAAIVAICGGGSFATVYQANERKRQELRTLAVWAFHGALDKSVPLGESQRMIDLLKNAGVTDVQLTVYPEANHDSWTVTFANPDLYRWLLRHERASTAGPR